MFINPQDYISLVLSLLGLLVTFMVISHWNFFAVSVKRLHDRNKSAWWLLLWYVISALGGALTFGIASLAVAIWVFVELGCLEGTPGRNRYGEATTGRNRYDEATTQTTLDRTPPAQLPGGVSAVSATHNGDSVDVTWMAADRATSYNVVYRIDDQHGWTRAVTNRGNDNTSYKLPGANSSKTYVVGVQAVNEAGMSDWTYSPPAKQTDATT